MAILALLSIVALALIILKAVTFINCKVGSDRNAQYALQLWRTNKKRDALVCLENSQSALDKSLFRAMKLIGEGKTFKEDLEDEVRSVATKELHQLQKGFKALEAIAQIAPLLGLFGTVIGMIDAFKNLQSAGNAVDPSILAGGIWVALLTTAVGLAVAIPVSLILTFFETRVEAETVAIQTLTIDVISQNPSEEVTSKNLSDVFLGASYAT